MLHQQGQDELARVPQLAREEMSTHETDHHGASVGQLDETARFYMAARGLSPDLSRRLLVQAFLGDALVSLEDDDLREAMMVHALDKVDKAL